MDPSDKQTFELHQLHRLVRGLYNEMGQPDKPPPTEELEDKPFGSYVEVEARITSAEMLRKMMDAVMQSKNAEN